MDAERRNISLKNIMGVKEHERQEYYLSYLTSSCTKLEQQEYSGLIHEVSANLTVEKGMVEIIRKATWKIWWLRLWIWRNQEDLAVNTSKLKS